MKGDFTMNDFTYSYPVKVYFGTDAAKKAVSQELGKYGKTVMVAYGGGSVKKSGVYDAVVSMLKEAGKEIVDFSGIMPNPTYAKVQEGAALAKEKQVDFILAVGGGSVIDCCKIISAQARERYLGDGVYGSCIPNGICSYGRDCDRNRNRC